MRYENLQLQTRVELLNKISAFLQVCGWSVKTDINNENILMAKDTLGGGLVFEFNSIEKDNNGIKISSWSKIYVCDNMDFSKEISEQDNIRLISTFLFQDNHKIELNKVYLIGDSKNFNLYLDNETSPGAYNLFFCSGYINKTHDFNGGRVIFSNIKANYTINSFSPTKIPFSHNTNNLFFGLGGNIYTMPDYLNKKNELYFLTNLIKPDANQTSYYYNELSSLSAYPLLEVNKSDLSGLYTLIKPNFFYKNNNDIFIHAGDFDMIRVFKENWDANDNFKNGQVLNLGSEKFVYLRPYIKSNNVNSSYSLVVKIA